MSPRRDRHLPVPASRRDRPIAKITGKMRLAAMFDAQGLTAQQIEEATNGVVKATYVYDLRQKQAYKDLVTAEMQSKSEGLALVIESLKSEATEAARGAITLLKQAIEAVDSEGREIWSVRLAALKIVMDNPALKAAIGAALSGDDDDGSKTVIGGEIHVHFGEQHLHTGDESPTVIEHPDIDSTAQRVD